MSKKKRLAAWLLSVVLCLGAVLPMPASAADLYFTSINDNLLPLTADTMPVWSGGLLYVPYTVFDSGTTGIRLGMDCSYSRDGTTVSLFTLRKILVFDLKNETCRNEMTGEELSAKAIIRNGRPYLPLNTVCTFFGLSRTYTSISQGYLVRIKNKEVVLSDDKFIDAAGELINRRVREYNQSLNPSQGGSTTNPSAPPEENLPSANVRTYLAFRCRDGESLSGVMDALDRKGVFALFLLTPQVLEEESELVRRMLGTGHSVGLLAEGEDLEQTRQLLAQGERLLEQTLFTRTTIAYAPKEQRAALEEEGWVCWSESHVLDPSDTVGPAAFANTTLRRLEGRTRATYLTMDADGNTARVLSTLLNQLDYHHFVVSIPMETRL